MFFAIAIAGKLSDFRPMKLRRLHRLVVALCVGVGLTATQAMDASMAMPDQPMSSNAVPAAESSCECCADCDDAAVTATCSFLCVSHPGSTDLSTGFPLPEIGRAVLPWAIYWTHLAIPPDLHPPRPSPVI